MEADSTTYDCNLESLLTEASFPFIVSPRNLKLYKDLTEDCGRGNIESQIVERLQNLGLLVKNVKCLSGKPECRPVCKSARVIDRVQWVCEVCGVRQAVRMESFFLKVQCSILQTLQIVFAWCEDADFEVAAQHFGVKPKVASNIYDKLDSVTAKEQEKCMLGGENSVVLVEMYPDCLTRLSPDTTDQPNVHKIVMLADTNNIPTSYSLHVLKEYSRRTNNNPTLYNQALKADLEEIIFNVALPNSLIVTCNNVPPLEGACSIQHLVQRCDADMQHFLTSRIWRSALSLCAASRDLGAGAGGGGAGGAGGGGAVQRYLNAALFRRRHAGALYGRALDLLRAARAPPAEC